LWRAYYYLGYETGEIECPVSEPEDEPDLSEPPSKWDPVFRVGWLDGCLGITNTQLQPGTPIGLMIFAPEDEHKIGRTVFKKRVSAVILGKTDSAENCPALADDVRDWNEGDGIGFYKVALENGQSLEPETLGIGVVRPEAGEDPFDLDGNGEADGFSICNGKNGLTFVAWSGEPYPTQAAGSEPLSDEELASQLVWVEFLDVGHKLAGVPDCPVRSASVPASELVGISRHHSTGTVHLPVLDPLNRIAVTADLPAAFGVRAILETHLIAIDGPHAGVVLSLDRSVGLIELRVGTGRHHRALDGVAADQRTDLVAR
jgi:hypothetical protein